MTTDVDGNYRGVYTYVNGERISVEDLGQIEGRPNNPLYYLNDALGSTIAITNMNAGIIDNNRFGPYGEAISPVAKNSRLTNSPWGYTGESHDIEGGLIYLRARYYEPNTGRFIQQDSYPYFGDTKNPLTRNLYLYGNGNPLMYKDPNGHIAITISAIVTYLLKNAAETVPDIILDYLIEGSSFKLWKSALFNFGYNLIPIVGEKLGQNDLDILAALRNDLINAVNLFK